MIVRLSAKKKNDGGYWLALITALLPVLATYASGIPGFSVADIILLIFLVKSLCSKSCKNEFSVSIKSLMLGIVLIIVFNFFSIVSLGKSQLLDMIIRTVRYLFYIICILEAERRELNITELKRLIKKIALLASVFVFVQYILYRYWNYALKGFLPFLRLYTEGYATREYNYNMFRPTSFFLEPAHYARYVSIAIVLYLFDDNNISTKEFISAVFISMGVIFSTSSQGYILLAFIWLFFALWRTRTIKNKQIKNWVNILILLAPFIIYSILRLPQVQATLWRSLSGDINVRTSALSARMYGYIIYLDLPLIKKIFGVGFGITPEGEWLNSAVYWLYGSGAIVFLIYVYFLLSSIVKLQSVMRMILILYTILFFTDDSFYNYMCILFLSLSILREKEIIIQGDVKSGEKNIIYCDRN